MPAPGPDHGSKAGDDTFHPQGLEHSAGRAQARGGLAAAAAFLERAAALTPDPARHAERVLAAAQASVQAGAFGQARDLLAAAEAGPLGDFQRAHSDLVRAQLAYVTSRGAEASPLLLKAARQVEQIDPGLSRATYLDALSAGMLAGRLASPESGILDIARAVVAAPPPPQAPRAPDLLLDALAAHYNDGYAAGVPMLRQALAVFGDGMSEEEEVHWLWLAAIVGATRSWDYDRWDVLSARHVQLARETGALSERDQVRTACTMFDSMGMAAFAARARAELRATGERARPHTPGAPEVLTPQEEQIARLVAGHLTNREIAARLFLSASTVEYHLRKIFRKLGVTSRAQLARTLQHDQVTHAK